jgi:hypothetical protein
MIGPVAYPQITLPFDVQNRSGRIRSTANVGWPLISLAKRWRWQGV